MKKNIIPRTIASVYGFLFLILATGISVTGKGFADRHVGIDILRSPSPMGPEEGFCPDGVFPGTTWPKGILHKPQTWGSFCKDGDAGVGWKTSSIIPAKTFLTLYVAGYPVTSDAALAVLNVATGQQLVLHVPVAPREKWICETFPLPQHWRQAPIRIVARDQSIRPTGWLAFSEPTTSDTEPTADISARRIICLTLIIFVVTLLPSSAMCVVAAHFGMSDTLDFVALAFLTLGLVGYINFWLYFANHTAGVIFTYAVLASSCCVLLTAMFVRKFRRRLMPLRSLTLPGALLILATVFVLSLGFLHGSQGSLLSMPASRYSPPELVGDNYLPKILADAVFAGHIPKPMHADWLSSDRPPLQAGNSLIMYPRVAERNRDLAYLVCSVILQCLFLVGLQTCLLAFNVSPKAVALAVSVCFFSGFVYLNSFYTWPKLYPSAFLLVFAAYLLPRHVLGTRKPIVAGAVVGGLTALSMLAHGGSAFALLGIFSTLLLFRRRHAPSFWMTGAIVAFALYFPWVLYQKHVDPPGDRLIKWHIAGIENPPPHESVTALIISNYRRLTIKEFLQLKLGNLKTIVGDLPSDTKNMWLIVAPTIGATHPTRSAAATALRQSMFYHFTSCIGLALFGPLALLVGTRTARHNQSEFIAASRMWLCTVVTIVLWCILMYGPDYTVVHQGTYFTVLFAMAGSWLAFWALSKPMAVALAMVQIGYNAVVYIFLTPPHAAAEGVAVIDPVFAGFHGMLISCLVSSAGILTTVMLADKQIFAFQVNTACGDELNESLPVST